MHCTILYYTVAYETMLSSNNTCYTILHYTIHYYILYHSILYVIILWNKRLDWLSSSISASTARPVDVSVRQNVCESTVLHIIMGLLPFQAYAGRFKGHSFSDHHCSDKVHSRGTINCPDLRIYPQAAPVFLNRFRSYRNVSEDRGRSPPSIACNLFISHFPIVCGWGVSMALHLD